MREWKEKQLSLVGEVVPIVRCHQHAPQLNLSVGGQVYGSTGTWEAMFTNKVSADALTVSKLFPGESPPAPAQKSATPSAGGGGGGYQAPVIIRIPPRDPQTPSALIDLTDYYNAGLTEGWHRVGASDASKHSDLAWLPRGTQSFAGTEFDVRGVVQLAGQSLKTKRYPPSVKGIRINRKCTTLHFLHGTGWWVSDGTRIGHYRVVYAGGDDVEIPLVYGADLRDWHMKANEGPEPTNSVVAWMGKTPAQPQNVTLQLFKTSWENPRAQLRIETLDYVSAMTNCAPFLIAITAE
jgi:hypothetical protein